MKMNIIEFLVNKYFNKAVKYIKLSILKIIWNNILNKIKIKILKNLNYIKL